MKEAKHKPSSVFVADKTVRNGSPRRVVRTPYTDIIEREGEALCLRPPADWYYPLYFCLYMTGEILLLETYANPRGQVAEAERLFVRTVDTLRKEVGLMPLVIQTLPLSEEMLHMNTDVGPVAISDILRLCSGLIRSGVDSVSLQKTIVEYLLRYYSSHKWHDFLGFGLGKFATPVASNM